MDTSIIIAASAVGGGLATSLFFANTLHRGSKIMAWANGEIERLTAQAANDKAWIAEYQTREIKNVRERNEARADRDNWRNECLELREKLTAAGKPDQPRDPITGRWLSKEAA